MITGLNPGAETVETESLPDTEDYLHYVRATEHNFGHYSSFLL